MVGTVVFLELRERRTGVRAVASPGCSEELGQDRSLGSDSRHCRRQQQAGKHEQNSESLHHAALPPRGRTATVRQARAACCTTPAVLWRQRSCSVTTPSVDTYMKRHAPPWVAGAHPTRTVYHILTGNSTRDRLIPRTCVKRRPPASGRLVPRGFPERLLRPTATASPP
jgi:hypothetical protein